MAAADIQRIEAAARMAMGSFEAPSVAAPIKARALSPLLYLLASVAVALVAAFALS